MTTSRLPTEPTRPERAWTGHIFLAGVGLAAAVYWLFGALTPDQPAGARPVAAYSALAEEHGCIPARAWPAGLFGDPATAPAGALLQSVGPDHLRVVWVPAGENDRWQPEWWLTSWCRR